MHRAVLPDLQFGQVKTERLGLPEQLLQLAEGLPGGVRLDERLLHQAEIVGELVWSRIGQSWPVPFAEPGRAQPLRRVQEIGAERLLRGARDDLRDQFRVRVPRGGERPGDVRSGRVGMHGERPADPLGGVLQRAQHVIGVDRRCLPGHPRGHERIAVPVAADPAAEPHEGGRLRCGVPGLRRRPVHGRGTGRAREWPGTAFRRTRSSRRGPRPAGAWPGPAARTCATAGRSPRTACAWPPRARWRRACRRPGRPAARRSAAAFR